MYTRNLFIWNLYYKYWLNSLVKSKSLLVIPLSQVSCNHSAFTAERTGLTQHTGRSKVAAPHSQRPTNHPPLAPWSRWQEAPLAERHVALRCILHKAFHRSLPLRGYQDCVSFLTCHPKLNLLTTGSKAKMCHKTSWATSSAGTRPDRRHGHRENRQEGRLHRPVSFVDLLLSCETTWRATLEPSLPFL